MSTLEGGGLYISIVTLGNPNGELRGQLFPPNDSTTAVEFVGDPGGEIQAGGTL